jgi:menaquinol-cytochrome c reductase iron-sulfur subunit
MLFAIAFGNGFPEYGASNLESDLKHFMQSQNKQSEPNRRSFFKEALAVVIGGVVGIVPLVAGIRTFFSPLSKKGESSGSDVPLIPVTTLEALPADGVPRKFPVLADKTDAWNKYKNVPIGAVYLRRTADDKIEALNVVCPHAGCFVDFVTQKGSYLCPCHNSTFKVDGKIENPGSPAPRGLDQLRVEVKDGTVLVAFQNFEAGRPDKVAVS